MGNMSEEKKSCSERKNKNGRHYTNGFSTNLARSVSLANTPTQYLAPSQTGLAWIGYWPTPDGIDLISCSWQLLTGWREAYAISWKR
jgi:hypothetical protein